MKNFEMNFHVQSQPAAMERLGEEFDKLEHGGKGDTHTWVRRLIEHELLGLVPIVPHSVRVSVRNVNSGRSAKLLYDVTYTEPLASPPESR